MADMYVDLSSCRSYLYNLGKNQEGLWQEYVAALEQAGHKRKKPS